MSTTTLAPKLTVNKKQVEAIFSAWWKDYWAHPEKFTSGPDFKGKSSADCFFEYAEKTGAGK